MKCLACVLVILAPACADPQPPETTPPAPTQSPSRWNFDEAHAPELPAGWRAAETNSKGKPGAWKIEPAERAPSPPNALVLTRTENYGSTYNLAIAETAVYKDLDLSVQIKSLRGQEDRGGGAIWRAIDENNYYICRFNPLEDNYRVYKVIRGRRTQLDSARISLDPGAWATIRVTMRGSRIECYLNDEKLLDVNDDTLPNAGHVGLWTKADAATAFDDLEVQPL